MKILIAVAVAFAVPSVVLADCPRGSVEYKNSCYSDLQPEKDNTPSVKPSEDKVPTDKMPSYEREGVNAVTPNSEIGNDIARDNEKKCATIKGKKTAKIKLIQEDQDFFDAVCKKLT